jgi:hypothetical protein
MEGQMALVQCGQCWRACRRKHSIHNVQNYLWLQAATGVLECIPHEREVELQLSKYANPFEPCLQQFFSSYFENKGLAFCSGWPGHNPILGFSSFLG